MNRAFRWPVKLTVVRSSTARKRGRMRLRTPALFGALVGVALVWPTASRAQDAAPPAAGIERLEPPAPDPAQVSALVKQLADESWSLRQEASEKLIALGPAALPALAECRRQNTDLQTHTDLGLIEAQIALNVAQSGRLIYLRLQSADAMQAVQEMAQQAGVTVQLEERRLRGVTLDGEIEGLSWWPAMLKLCAAHDLDARPGESGMRITRATDGPSRTLVGPSSTDGPMLVLARGARYERTLSFNRNPVLKRDGSIVAEEADVLRQARFIYDLEAMLEPRFLLGSRRFTVLLTGASDDAGNVLMAVGAADGGDLAGDIAAAARAGADPAMVANITEGEWSGGRLRIGVPLVYPVTPGTRLHLSGRVRGLVGADLHEVQATSLDLAAGVAWHVAGERVNVRLEAGSTAGRWTFTAESARAVAPEVADLLAAALSQAELSDAAGDRLRRGAMQSSTGEDGRYACRLEFIGSSEETTLPREVRCRVPRRALELDVPFEFESLPMP